MKTASILQSVLAQPGMTQELAWNECTVQLVKAAVVRITEFHCYLYHMRSYMLEVKIFKQF